jgi:hypothetical protein
LRNIWWPGKKALSGGHSNRISGPHFKQLNNMDILFFICVVIWLFGDVFKQMTGKGD